MTKLLVLVAISISIEAQAQKPQRTADIHNDVSALRMNHVSSMTATKYYVDKKHIKAFGERRQKLYTEYYDSIGRAMYTVSYDIDQQVLQTTRYYPADTEGGSFYKVEIYDKRDSLVRVAKADTVDGQVVGIVLNRGVMCFGYFQLEYQANDLIDKAIWMGPKKGVWANKNMMPVFAMELVYTYKH